VSLLNYKIATGSAKLVNHPILSDIVLAPGEEKIITRVDSKIVLNNKAGKIALLYPDGKAADETQYAKAKIENDEAFTKIDGQWQWIAAKEKKNDDEKNKLALQEPNQPNDEILDQSAVLGASDEKISSFANYRPGFSAEDAFIFLSRIGFLKPPANYSPMFDFSSNIAYILASMI
jgi:hypothetical protein